MANNDSNNNAASLIKTDSSPTSKRSPVEPFSGRGKPVIPGGYQSPEHGEKAEEYLRSSEQDDSAESEEASINSKDGPSLITVNQIEEMNKLVEIRPRQNIPRTKIGRQTYSFVAGKKTRVPRHVAMLLDQKGYL